MNSTALTRDLFGRPWAILPEKMEALAEMVERHAAGLQLSADAIERLAAEGPQNRTVGNAIGVLPLFGTIHRHGDLLHNASGGTSTARFGADFDSMLADSKIGTIVLQVNSPGGSVYGVEELAAKIFEGNAEKRIVAAVDPMCASAALWIATAAKEVYVTPSGEIGSIGVISIHEDISAAEEAAGIKTTIIRTPDRKARGNPYEPLDEQTYSRIVETNLEYYGRFVRDVARNRGVTKSAVEKSYGGGEMLTAPEAKAAGLIDGIMSFDLVLDMVAEGRKRKGQGNRNKMRAALAQQNSLDV